MGVWVKSFSIVVGIFISMGSAFAHESENASPNFCQLILNADALKSDRITVLQAEEMKLRLESYLARVRQFAAKNEMPSLSTSESLDQAPEVAVTIQPTSRTQTHTTPDQVRLGYSRLARVVQEISHPDKEVVAIEANLSTLTHPNGEIKFKQFEFTPGGLLAMAGISGLSGYLVASGEYLAASGIFGLFGAPTIGQVIYLLTRTPNPELWIDNADFTDFAVEEYLHKNEIRYIGLSRSQSDTSVFSSSDRRTDIGNWIFNRGMDTRIVQNLRTAVMKPLIDQYGAGNVHLDMLLEKTSWRSMRVTLVLMRQK